jgi:hypothetical protein
MRFLIVSFLVVLAGCTAIPLAQDPHEAFQYIRGAHAYHVYFNKCSDMAQQFRDYLYYRHGVAFERMRLCHGPHKFYSNMAHAWLEVYVGREWLVFDPTLGAYSYKYRDGDIYSFYNFSRSPGHVVLVQPPIYPYSSYDQSSPADLPLTAVS